MNIGLNILKDLKINIGDSLQKIKDTLEENNIEYTIHEVASKDSDNTINIMYIQQQGVELSIKDDRINFIKSNNIGLNYIFAIDNNENAVRALSEIKSKVANLFGVNEKDITVNEFNGDEIRAVITLKNDTQSVKLSLMLGLGDKIYINTIRLI